MKNLVGQNTFIAIALIVSLFAFTMSILAMKKPEVLMVEKPTPTIEVTPTTEVTSSPSASPTVVVVEEEVSPTVVIKKPTPTVVEVPAE